MTTIAHHPNKSGEGRSDPDPVDKSKRRFLKGVVGVVGATIVGGGGFVATKLFSDQGGAPSVGEGPNGEIYRPFDVWKPGDVLNRVSARNLDDDIAKALGLPNGARATGVAAAEDKTWLDGATWKGADRAELTVGIAPRISPEDSTDLLDGLKILASTNPDFTQPIELKGTVAAFFQPLTGNVAMFGANHVMTVTLLQRADDGHPVHFSPDVVESRLSPLVEQFAAARLI